MSKENFDWKIILKDLILSIDSISYKKSHWGQNFAFFINNREIAHFEGENSIDLRLTKKYQKLLDKSIMKNVVFRTKPSEWINFNVNDEKDIELAFKLFEKVVEANIESLQKKKTKIL
jgi:hypothetical protein